MADMVLPQLSGEVFLTDGGLETDMIFLRGLELPEFASFVLLDDESSRQELRSYFRDYLDIGSSSGLGVVVETPTWRASSRWGEMLGYDAARLRDVNRRAVELVTELRERDGDGVVVVSGCVGPCGDAYADLGSMDPAQAESYHRPQIEVLAGSGVDLVSALTITNVPEAIGVVRAAQRCDIPVVVSFTVETDGSLPTGMALGEAIAAVDEATASSAAYDMVNCAHPDHFEHTFAAEHASLDRVRGVRANASRQSHVELDESEVLDDGDPVELGAQLAALHARSPHISVLGGCCGTDRRHIAELARCVQP